MKTAYLTLFLVFCGLVFVFFSEGCTGTPPKNPNISGIWRFALDGEKGTIIAAQTQNKIVGSISVENNITSDISGYMCGNVLTITGTLRGENRFTIMGSVVTDTKMKGNYSDTAGRSLTLNAKRE